MQEKSCNVCQHWSKSVCLDSEGKPIERKESLAPEPFWYYEECKKNWGLPHNAYTNAKVCRFYKLKG